MGHGPPLNGLNFFKLTLEKNYETLGGGPPLYESLALPAKMLGPPYRFDNPYMVGGWVKNCMLFWRYPN